MAAPATPARQEEWQQLLQALREAGVRGIPLLFRWAPFASNALMGSEFRPTRGFASRAVVTRLKSPAMPGQPLEVQLYEDLVQQYTRERLPGFNPRRPRDWDPRRARRARGRLEQSTIRVDSAEVIRLRLDEEAGGSRYIGLVSGTRRFLYSFRLHLDALQRLVRVADTLLHRQQVPQGGCLPPAILNIIGTYLAEPAQEEAAQVDE